MISNNNICEKGFWIFDLGFLLFPWLVSFLVRESMWCLPKQGESWRHGGPVQEDCYFYVSEQRWFYDCKRWYGWQWLVWRWKKGIKPKVSALFSLASWLVEMLIFCKNLISSCLLFVWFFRGIFINYTTVNRRRCNILM